MCVAPDRNIWRRDRGLDPVLIERARTVSLDVFDTLIVRECGTPEAVFRRTAARAAAAGLFSSPDAAEWFPRVRADAQRAAESAERARRFPFEISFEAIYDQLPESLGDRAAIAAIEWAEERAAVRANPFLLSLLADLKERGVPAILMSDMYLAGARIAELLAAAGIGPDRYEALIVSSDHGCRKSDGALFDRLSERHPETPPAAMLHIGHHPPGDQA
ncbi:MAG: hypothetical protein JOY64_01545, partial [Alphaproteobacteria bacterium]|nr:hypothetical protein [Alphaproteobacteria bacterium]